MLLILLVILNLIFSVQLLNLSNQKLHSEEWSFFLTFDMGKEISFSCTNFLLFNFEHAFVLSAAD